MKQRERVDVISESRRYVTKQKEQQRNAGGAGRNEGKKRKEKIKKSKRTAEERVGIKEKTTFRDNSLDIGKLLPNNDDLDVNI